MKNLQEFVNYLRKQGFSEKIIEAFSKIDRSFFVPDEYKEIAYEDTVIPIKDGVTISQPTVLASMIELLELKPGLNVLEIGTGSGYSTAIISYLLGESGKIISIEIDEYAYRHAKERLKKLVNENIIPDNITLILGDGSLGYPEEAPFDRIISHAASHEIPKPWIWQLKENGIIVAPIGTTWQKLVKVIKKQSKLEKQYFTNVIFVPLRGKFGEL